MMSPLVRRLVPPDPVIDIGDIYPVLEVPKGYIWFQGGRAYRNSRYQELDRMRERLTLDLLVGAWVRVTRAYRRPSPGLALRTALSREEARP